MANYKKNLNPIIIFSDFDATITEKDLTDEIFKLFGNYEHYLSQLKEKKITIFEYWQEFCKALPLDFFGEPINQFIAKQGIDYYFSDFLSFCYENNFPFTIITDNFAEIVNPFLKYFNLNNLSLFSNKIIFQENKYIPVFPFANENCEECISAVCKRNIILSQLPEDAIVVYIGDGFSDSCAANYCDIVFAKDYLASYCSVNRIPHFSYKSFFEVKRILEKLLNSNKLRNRYQAQLNRKRAYEIE